MSNPFVRTLKVRKIVNSKIQVRRGDIAKTKKALKAQGYRVIGHRRSSGGDGLVF